MAKALFIAEKPSVAREFAKYVMNDGKNNDGYIEGNEAIVTWCVGHLVTMSYPEAYDANLKRWSMQTLPFLPEEYKYEVIASAAKQFKIVSALLKRDDVDTIYVATDSGREGEYIYRLVEQQSGVTGKNRKRVWVDSQTEEAIRNGIRDAKDLSEYDNLAASAYLRAKEDYLMGINFSRALSLKYCYDMKQFLGTDKMVIAVGRVMTCVLGMVVRREREIRDFVKTPFFRVLASALPFDAANAPIAPDGSITDTALSFDAEWKAVEGSGFFNSPKLYKENGFKKEDDAKELIAGIVDSSSISPLVKATVEDCQRKTEKKNAPLLYNLAELQNDCSKFFKISPDETLRVIQELYEKKLVTYPRTDARVLSSAVAKEIDKNLKGLLGYPVAAPFAKEILDNGSYKSIGKTKYTDDKKITDHYAVIPTGAGLNALSSLAPLAQKIYEIIVHRFLAIFYPPAVYQKLQITAVTENNERFFSGFKVMTDEGYLKATRFSFVDQKKREAAKEEKKDEEKEEEQSVNPALLAQLKTLKKGSPVTLTALRIKEGETSPPKRYNSGNIVLAMENAGNLIEDELLREQIKGSGIGTAATRGEIFKKLNDKGYIFTNKKTQIITPTLVGEMIYEVVNASIPQMLNPELTASWEKGLTQVAEGSVSEDEYMTKLNGYVGRRTENVKKMTNSRALLNVYKYIQGFYDTKSKGKK